MLVDFYQLSHDPAPRAVAQVAAKVLESGARLLVVAEEPSLREGLSEALWATDGPAFLANGLAGGPHDASQPILLGQDVAAANGAGFVALADGVWRDEVLDGRFDRVFLFFDGARVEAARGCWRELGGRDGVERRFWKQVDGRWTRAG